MKKSFKGGNEMGPLLHAIDQKDTSAALEIIRNKSDSFTQTDVIGSTPLIMACQNKMPEVALALIATGESNPAHFNIIQLTALFWACAHKMSDVALALIATGESNPGHDISGTTALMVACGHNMPEVVLALIATGESKPEQVDGQGKQAVDYAREAGMREDIMIALNDPKTIRNKALEQSINRQSMNKNAPVRNSVGTQLLQSTDFSSYFGGKRSRHRKTGKKSRHRKTKKRGVKA